MLMILHRTGRRLPHRRVHEQVGELKPLKVLLLPDQRREQDATFVHPREPGLPAEVGAGRLAAIQQPQDRPGDLSENLRASREDGEAGGGASYFVGGRSDVARDLKDEDATPPALVDRSIAKAGHRKPNQGAQLTQNTRRDRDCHQTAAATTTTSEPATNTGRGAHVDCTSVQAPNVCGSIL